VFRVNCHGRRPNRQGSHIKTLFACFSEMRMSALSCPFLRSSIIVRIHRFDIFVLPHLLVLFCTSVSSAIHNLFLIPVGNSRSGVAAFQRLLGEGLARRFKAEEFSLHAEEPHTTDICLPRYHACHHALHSVGCFRFVDVTHRRRVNFKSLSRLRVHVDARVGERFARFASQRLNESTRIKFCNNKRWAVQRSRQSDGCQPGSRGNLPVRGAAARKIRTSFSVSRSSPTS
jgi:hypothetical protein